MSRTATTAVATAALSLLLPLGTATAAPPPPGGTYTFDAGLVCAFPISYTETVNGEVLRDHPHFGIVTGAYKVTVTNLAKGTSLAVNVAGPTLYGATSTADVGPWLFVLYPDDATGPGLFLLKGYTTAVRDANGVLTTLQTKGSRSADLCAQLA